MVIMGARMAICGVAAACGQMLITAPAQAQESERTVVLSDDPVPVFLTPLSADGFIGGRSDAIPELTEAAVEAFFGDRRQRILYDGKLTAQLMDALSGPPFDQIDLGNGYFVYVACKQHSCAERGAVIMDRAGGIVAAEIIGYRCREEPEPACDDTPVAYAFIDDDFGGDFAERIFAEWAAMTFQALADTDREYLPPVPPIERVLHVSKY